jgi:hypothetical protein
MDLARLIALWEDRTLTTEEVAEQLGCALKTLYAVAARHGLGRRRGARRKRAGRDDGTEITWRDPTPAEIEQMKEQIWQKKLAKLRQETPQETAERIYRENMQLAAD